MAEPTLADYVHLIFTLFDLFVQHQQGHNGPKPGRPFTFAEKAMIVFSPFSSFDGFSTSRRSSVG
jgi:hypothetical protein